MRSRIPSSILRKTIKIVCSRPDLGQVEKKRQELKSLQEQRERFEVQMALFNQKQAAEKEELERMTNDLQQSGLNAGHQSEPTTPPEYRDATFGSTFGRNNRYSVSSITSPPGLVRSSRSGSQLTSPPSELAQTIQNNTHTNTLPSKSVPGSRRGSNEAIRAYVPETNGTSRRIAAAYFIYPSEWRVRKPR